MATLAATLVALVSLPARAQSGDVVHQEVLSKAQGMVTLYRGASSEAAFTPKALKEVGTREDLVKAVASRLTSTSDQVTGLTNNPRTAGAFALGVKDGDPNTVRTYGLANGFIGVTEARNMSASDFAGLLQKHGGTKSGLNKLLGTMASANVVVDASGMVNALSGSYPGILTRGFQEMISASLSREAEYLVFGKNPAFKRVHRVQKSDVIDPNYSVTGAGFRSDLSSKLSKEPKRTETVKRAPAHRPTVNKTVTTGVKTTAKPKVHTTSRPPVRAQTVKPKRQGFFKRMFSFRKKASAVRR